MVVVTETRFNSSGSMLKPPESLDQKVHKAISDPLALWVRRANRVQRVLRDQLARLDPPELRAKLAQWEQLEPLVAPVLQAQQELRAQMGLRARQVRQVLRDRQAQTGDGSNPPPSPPDQTDG